MSQILLDISFHSQGPWGEQLLDACRELADSIAQQPGLIWKVWTENPDTRRAGGVYLFENMQLAEDYLQMHRERLEAFGVMEMDSRLYQVNEPLSRITHAPI